MKFSKTGAIIGGISGIVGALLGSWIDTTGLLAFAIFFVILISVSIGFAILRKRVRTAETEQKPKPAD